MEYVHRNLDKLVSFDGLAAIVHMSKTTFHDHFRDMMHISRFEYTKSVILHKAQALIQEGKKASEAAYQVGYNSPAQFTQEHRRHFGFSPSAT